MNILIPMAGNGQRFVDAGFIEPKPFIDVLGKPMIERVVENLGGPSVGRFIFVVRDLSAMHRVRAIVPTCEVVVLRDKTEGAACTALHAAWLFNDDEPLLIANSDQIVEPIEIPKGGEGGLIWTFEATHPKWSYAATDTYSRVWAVAEKQVISTHATVGIYYWYRGRDFVRCAQKMIGKDLRVNGEFYIAPAFNQLIAEGPGVWARPVKTMWGLGTPEDLKLYEDAHRT